MADSKETLEKRQKMGELVTAQRAILDKAREEKRELTSDEDQTYNRMDAEVEALDKDVQKAMATEEREAKLAEREARGKERPAAIKPGVEDKEQRDRIMVPSKYRRRWDPATRAAFEARGSQQYGEAFDSYLMGGDAALTPDEKRALSVGTASEGGYTVPTQEFINQLIKAADNAMPVGAKCTSFDVPQAQSLGVPTLEADPDDADWTSELLVGNTDAAMAFGKRELIPNPLAKLLKVSKKWLRATPVGGEGIVRDRLAYKVAVPTEKGILTGTGSGQPLGLFTASASGIPTSRDVTVSTTSALDADKLLDARYTLRDGYMPTWVLHRTTIAAIRKLKATTGDYLWMPGLTAGAPSLLLDFPIIVDEYAPAYATAGGSYVAVFGDLSYYWIARALNFEIQRLDELYAATNQVGFIVRAEIDGQPVLADAFVRCVM